MPEFAPRTRGRSLSSYLKSAVEGVSLYCPTIATDRRLQMLLVLHLIELDWNKPELILEVPEVYDIFELVRSDDSIRQFLETWASIRAAAGIRVAHGLSAAALREELVQVMRLA